MSKKQQKNAICTYFASKFDCTHFLHLKEQKLMNKKEVFAV